MKCDLKVLNFRQEQGAARLTCSRCSLAELCLPDHMDHAEVARMEQLVERLKPNRAGQYLFRAGDKFEEIFAIRSGCYKSFLIDENGEEKVIDFHLPGEIVGFDAIHGGTHVSTCVALDSGAVCTLKFNAVSDLARQLPALQSRLFDIMSHRIQDLEIVRGNHGAERRFAMFLESFSRRYSRRGYSAREFSLAMSRKDIANYLQLAAETVSRVLYRMKQQGILDLHRRQLKILNPEALHEIALHQQ